MSSTNVTVPTNATCAGNFSSSLVTNYSTSVCGIGGEPYSFQVNLTKCCNGAAVHYDVAHCALYCTPNTDVATFSQCAVAQKIVGQNVSNPGSVFCGKDVPVENGTGTGEVAEGAGMRMRLGWGGIALGLVWVCFFGLG